MRVDEDEVVEEAQKRFRECTQYFSRAYGRWHDDWKFGHGDSYNNAQWAADLMRTREMNDEISLTINKTRQHCLQIVNGLANAESAIKYTAVSDEASEDAAEAFEGLARNIEYVSNARAIYRRAITHSVFSGIGYWRIVTDYRDNESQDQDIFLRSVKDPTRIYVDPDCTEPDWSDMRYGFVYDEMPREEFERMYPSADGASNDAFGMIWRNANSRDKIGIVEYFRKVHKRERMYYLASGETVLSSSLTPDIRAELEEKNTESRMIETCTVQWFKLCGSEVLEKTIWPGTYIPIVPCFGEVLDLDGDLDLVGHVRQLIDPQKQYNYMRSAATQSIALQNKIPYVAPVAAISGLETYWETANTANHAILPYNAFDDEGRPMPPPARQPGPVMPQAYMAATEAAATDMQMVSGQFEASMGEPSNERSGVAIKQRQMAGEQAADHFQQSFAMAIRLTGKILLDLIPKVYTAKRVVMILGPDGKQSRVTVDPGAAQAHQEAEDKAENEARAVFNPRVGRYEVTADIGPGFLTRRQQSFEALMEVMTNAREWAPVIGDLLMKNAPFPAADEMAERLYRMVPPQALGGPPPEVAKLQADLVKLQQTIQHMVIDAAEQKLRGQRGQEQKQIDAYKAETDRAEALKEIDPMALRPLVMQLVREAMGNSMNQSAPVVPAMPDGAPAPMAQPQ